MDNNVSGVDADISWIFRNVGFFSYNEGTTQQSDCPDLGKETNPCWAFCEGSMRRSNATIGYQNISLTYSIDPWRMVLPHTYC